MNGTESNLTATEFQALAVSQMDTLYRVALRLTGQRVAAEDLVQETYLKALRAWKSFRLHEFGIRPWLLRIMKNVHLSTAGHDRLRPRPIYDRYFDRAGGNGDDNATVLSSNSPGLFDEMDQRLVCALEYLPKQHRLALLLWAVDGLSYRDIADSLKVPLGTVMSRLHRARKRLIERLGDHAF
jgi:RNA polymerase sigma-70 factor (ECF subfamily)